jgi:serine/threonine protein kinase
VDALPHQVGRYEIQRRIGQGGMGALYLANDPNTHRLVALKLLNATLNSTEFRQRFLREVRALAALSHPNIVSAYDAGEFEGALYFVMEFVDGETLSALIGRRAAMSVPQKLKLMTELCAGLAQAHAAGIIHRDIKPANLMVDRQGRLKILDFGIARLVQSRLSGTDQPLTLVSVAIGTPGYMSPEQMEGREVDRRTDIFAVGAVCHELFSYDVAFSGSNVGEIERQVLHGQPAPLASLVPGLDPEIDRIVSRALNRDPDRRYQGAAAFGQALEGVRLRLEPGAPRTTLFATPPSQIEQTVIIRSPIVPAATHPSRTIVSTPVGGAGRPPAPPETVVRTPVGAQGRPAETIVRPPAGMPSRPTPSSETIVGIPLGGLDRPMPSAETIIGAPAAASGRPITSAETILARPAPERQASRHEPPRKDNRVPPKRREPLWTRYPRTAQVLGALVIVAVLVLAGLVLYNILTPDGHMLTITRPTGGTLTAAGIKCGTRGSECSSIRPVGEQIELVPEPDDGFELTAYTDDCAPSGRTLMAGKRTCGATFAAAALPLVDPNTQLLTIAPVPTGGTLKGLDILCGTQGTMCSFKHIHGVPVDLQPEPDPGYTFMRFTGDCVPIGRLQMTAPRTCSAVFSRTDSLAPEKPLPAPVGPAARGGSSTAQPKDTSQPGPPPPPTGTKTPPGPPPPPVDPPPVIVQKAEAPIPDDVFAKQRIQQTLDAYCKAIIALDPLAVQKVFPKANMTAFRNQLNKNAYKSVECTFGEPKYLDLDASPAGKAKIQVELKTVYEHTSVKKPDVHEQIADMSLYRVNERSPFLIDTVSFKPKPKK